MTPSKPNLSDTQVERVVERFQHKPAAKGSRFIEDALAIAGIIQAMVYGTLEALRHSGVAFGKCEAASGFPWVTISILALCVAPKTLGRATAGRIWDRIAPSIGGKS